MTDELGGSGESARELRPLDSIDDTDDVCVDGTVFHPRGSSSRTLMLPSLAAMNPRACRRRPTSTISARTCSSICMGRKNVAYPCRLYSRRHPSEQK